MPRIYAFCAKNSDSKSKYYFQEKTKNKNILNSIPKFQRERKQIEKKE